MIRGHHPGVSVVLTNSVSFFRRVDLKLDEVGIVLPAANEVMSFSVHQYLRW
jgi:hypothetical protein